MSGDPAKAWDCTNRAIANRALLAIILSICCSLVGCTFRDCDPVSGVVIDAISGKPVAGAKVTATYSLSRTSTARTDREGKFRFGAHSRRKPIMMDVKWAQGHTLLGLHGLSIDVKGYTGVAYWRSGHADPEPDLWCQPLCRCNGNGRPAQAATQTGADHFMRLRRDNSHIYVGQIRLHPK